MRHIEEDDDDESELDVAEMDVDELRTFKSYLLDDEEELLPLKVDGSLVRRTRKRETLENEEDADDEPDEPKPKSKLTSYINIQ